MRLTHPDPNLIPRHIPAQLHFGFNIASPNLTRTLPGSYCTVCYYLYPSVKLTSFLTSSGCTPHCLRNRITFCAHVYIRVVYCYLDGTRIYDEKRSHKRFCLWPIFWIYTQQYLSPSHTKLCKINIGTIWNMPCPYSIMCTCINISARCSVDEGALLSLCERQSHRGQWVKPAAQKPVFVLKSIFTLRVWT